MAAPARATARVVIALPRNGTTSHVIDPTNATGGGTVVGGTPFTPTANRLLVFTIEGAVTSTTPTGCTLPVNGSAVNNTGLYVMWKTAASGSNATSTTHNGSNYPVVVTITEYPAGSTFVKAASGVNLGMTAASPGLTGLTGTNDLWSIIGVGIFGGSGTWGPTTWSGAPTPTKDADLGTVQVTTDGYGYSDAFVDASTAASWTPTASAVSAATSAGNKEAITFAINVPTGSQSAAPALSGSGTLTAAAAASVSTILQLSATGQLAVFTNASVPSMVALGGSGQLSASASPTVTRPAAFSGSGELVASASASVAAPVALGGSGQLDASSTPSVAGPSALGGVGQLAASAEPAVPAPVALGGIGQLTLSAHSSTSAAAVFGGMGQLTADSATNATALAALTGAGALDAGGEGVARTSVAFGGIGQLTATADAIGASAPSFTGVGSLSVTMLPSVSESVGLGGVGQLDATGHNPAVAQNITVAGWLQARRWAASVGGRDKTGAIAPRRWGGTL